MLLISRKNDLPLFAQWDADNSGIEDSSPSSAINLNDASGTFQNYILIREFDSKNPKTSGKITLTANCINSNMINVFTASATYYIGSSRDWGDTPLETNATWDSFNDGGNLSGLHDYLSGNITNGSIFSFAKKTFADNEGYSNSNSVTLTFNLEITNGVTSSVNSDKESLNDFGYIQEWLTFPLSMDKLQSDVYIVSGFGSEQAYQGDFSFIFLSGDRGWTDRKTFEQYDTVAFGDGGLATQLGGKGKVDIRTDNPSATNTEIYTSLNRNIYRFEFSGFDGDGKPIISNFVPIKIGFSTTGVNWRWAIYPSLYTNGVPLIFTQNTISLRQISILQNNIGTYSTPDCEIGRAHV